MINESDEPLVVSNILPFLTPFTEDVVTMNVLTHAEYDAREPGFRTCFYNAYIAAFQDKSRGRITHDLLKKINKMAMQHKPPATTEQYGEYTNLSSFFQIIPKVTQDGNSVVTYNSTSEGIEEFISYWMINQSSSIHTFRLSKKQNGTTKIKRKFLDPRLTEIRVCSMDKKLYFYEAFQNNTSSAEIFDLKKHGKKIHYALSVLDFYSFIHVCEENDTKKLMDVQKEIHAQVQNIINDYEEEILGAITDNEKITVIARQVQRIEQIHPFCDGNIRTCYILINKLLRDHGLPLTILFNPNQLDACSLSQIVDLIKEGQTYYQQLLNNMDLTQFAIRKGSRVDGSAEYICRPYMDTPMDVLKSFYDTVIKNHQSAAFSSVFTQSLTIFSQRPRSTYYNMLQETIRLKLQTSSQAPKNPQIQYDIDCITTILSLLKNAHFSQAFHTACLAKLIPMIQIMLTIISEIDINEPSHEGKTALDLYDTSLIEREPQEDFSMRETLLQYHAK